MGNLRSLWANLDTKRRIIVGLAGLAAFVAIIAMSRMAGGPNLALLYSGLEGRQSADVIRALDDRNVAYEIRGSAIYVPTDRRDALRMVLAGEGLPSNTGAGYELLDSLSGFGTTSQMFDAAYWRAKEGELARTIVASDGIREARVHIANPAPGPFRRDQQTTASVALTTSGAGVPPAAAEAYRFLVASAVPGLAPADVAIIDSTTGQVVRAGETATGAGQVGERAAELKANVERLLAARFGSGNAIVEVSVDPVTEAERLTERRIDPDSRVAISTDVEESSQTGSETGNPGVTVASNVPDGDAEGEGASSESQSTTTREVTNYDVSETTREIQRSPGAVKRLTAAVLVDSAALSDADGAAADPGAELADIRDLVQSAVGYDEARGDVVTVKSMPFEPAGVQGTPAPQSWWQALALSPMRLIQLGVLAAVALALGLFVVRPIMANGARAGADDARLVGSELDSASDIDGSAIAAGSQAANGGFGTAPDSGLPALSAAADDGATIDGDATEVSDPVADLRKLIEDRQPDTIEILRTWLEDDSVEERA